jgi:hypothetical protein
MATLPELAERGIVGSADVLPVPVGPEPRLESGLTAEQRATLAAQLGDAKPARDGLLVSFGESIRDRREHDHTSQREDWFCMNLAAYMGERVAPVLRRLLDAEARVAELESGYVAPSPSCTRCYGADAARFVAQGGVTTPCPVCGPSEIESLRARIAELEAERHVTNEALSDAAEQLRADRDRIAELEGKHGRTRVLDRAEYGNFWDLVPHGTDRERIDALVVRLGLLPPAPPSEPGTCPAWYWDGSGWWQCVEAEGHHVGEGHHNGGDLAWDGDAVYAGLTSRADVPDGLGVAAQPDALTQLMAPTQALRDEDPNHLRHTYRLGRDLPETGGVQ